ncbi:MAG: hypothetical protein WKF73_07710 [Nocardioidaceae bacterium]
MPSELLVRVVWCQRALGSGGWCAPEILRSRRGRSAISSTWRSPITPSAGGNVSTFPPRALEVPRLTVDGRPQWHARGTGRHHPQRLPTFPRCFLVLAASPRRGGGVKGGRSPSRSDAVGALDADGAARTLTSRGRQDLPTRDCQDKPPDGAGRAGDST